MSTSAAATTLPKCEVPIGLETSVPKSVTPAPVPASAPKMKIEPHRMPRDLRNDYSHKIASDRREFISRKTGAKLSNIEQYTFDPSVMRGNVENFIGVAQIPIGVAGPLLVDGENAQGEFYIPIATTEGAVVASYNRGMRLLSEAGGVKATVVDDGMQRAPVFIFPDARESKRFGAWVERNLMRPEGAFHLQTVDYLGPRPALG